MSKPGNYTAYQQYKPLDNGTTQALQHWSNFAEQKRQNDIAAEQRDKEFDYKVEKDIADEKDKWLTFPKLDTTGVADVDQFYGAAMQNVYQKRIDLVSDMEGYKRNSPEWTKSFIKLKKLDMIPEKLKLTTNQQLQDGAKYYKERGKTLVKTDANDNAFSNLKSPKAIINEDTMELGFEVTDPNDATKTMIVTAQEILNGASQFKLIPQYDDNKWTQENIKLLNAKPPYYMDTDETTGKPVIKTGYDKEKAIRPYVRTSLFIDDEPTEQGLSFGAQLGYTTKELKDPAIQEKIVGHYTDRLHSALTQGEKIDKDSENLRLKEAKDKATASYQNRQATTNEKNAGTRVAIGEGSGKIQKPVTMTDFVKGTVPRTDGKVLFNVKNNALIVNYGQGDNAIQRNVTGVIINPNDPNDITINYIETGKRLEGRRIEPYNEQKTYNSTTDGEMTGTFSAEFGSTLSDLHATLKKKAGIKDKPKAKETPQERIARLKKEKGLK